MRSVIRWAPPSEEELAARGLQPERARESDGTFRADDPTTPENEAWVPPKAPRRRVKKGLQDGE